MSDIEHEDQPDEIEIELEEITPTAYRWYLLENRWNTKQRVTELDGMLGRLDVAEEDRNLTIYCFESEDGVMLKTVEKSQAGFVSKPPEIEFPEGAQRISIHRYREVIEEMKQRAMDEFSQLESLLEALDKALENTALRVTCFRTQDGAGMKTEEKGPIGFRPSTI